ncbi:AAA family ATPase [Actinoplanes sp. NPDC049681]|uniref:AAA family ATPase n=1 Tax=Actinoplanes sp. NPDC049681 TaxID=3363905 RepID=UPI0037A4262D
MARDVVMVNGLPGSGKSTVAPRLAAALGAVCLDPERIEEALSQAVVTEVPGLPVVAMETVWTLAAALSGMVVIDAWFPPRDLERVRAGLARTGATATVEVWCEAPADVARARFSAGRRRPSVHADGERLARDWAAWAAEAEPLGLGPVVRIDTTGPLALPELADRIRKLLWDRSDFEKPGGGGRS